MATVGNHIAILSHKTEVWRWALGATVATLRRIAAALKEPRIRRYSCVPPQNGFLTHGHKMAAPLSDENTPSSQEV